VEDVEVAVLEDLEVEMDRQEEVGVTSVIIAIKKDIMPKIVRNLQKEESQEPKTVDALYVMKKVIRK
jgi:hypothetical protein